MLEGQDTFSTITSTLFYPFAEMFYTRIPNSRRVIKVLPPMIEKLLTPCALAYWIMDDGQYVKNGGLTLCTDNFTSREVAVLKTILENKYGLLCTLHNKKKMIESIFQVDPYPSLKH